MAEIKIEKKKPVWPWVLLIIILLAAVAYFVYTNNEKNDYPDDMESEEIDDMNSDAMNDSITYKDAMDFPDSTSAMVQYSESIKDSTRIGTDSTYTKTALQNLSRIVVAKAAKYNLESSKALEDLKQYSEQIDRMNDSKMPNASDMSNNFKTVSNNIVTVLQAIQTKNFPMLQKNVADLKQTSSKLTTTSMAKQKTTLQTFFRTANEVLNKMNS